MKILQRFIVSVTLCAVAGMGMDAAARTRDTEKSKKQDEVLRAAKGVLDQQQNKVSSISFHTTNYGIFGLNVAANIGGGYWPRGSKNQYIFGGGIWFGALKLKAGDTVPNKLAVISYNPNSGGSWMAPGRIEDGDKLDNNGAAKYRAYFSTDFDQNGIPFNKADGPNWPIWDTQPNDTLKRNRYFGNYVNDITQRNTGTYPKGPAYISEEDIFTVFKDTDLDKYEISESVAAAQGFPMRLQFEQTIYSWGFGDYKDFIFLKYLIVNKSPDILRECYMAPAMDMDIATSNNVSDGATNDHTKFYDTDESLNLAVQWSDGNKQEAGKGFGYIGFDFLESPAVDASSNIRRDKKVFETNEQLGLHTFRNWTIANDPLSSDLRYSFMSTGNRDGDDGPGDKRFLMSTGPFTMQPGDTARVVVGLIMASAATDQGTKSAPTGTVEDMAELVRKDNFAQSVYDNNFKAPKPPDAPRLTWEPINNGVVVHWDSTAEISYDELEGGLDFLGYRLYRARNKDLDSFDVDFRTLGGSPYRSPLGWKEVAAWQMPFPFAKSSERVSADVKSPFFDQVVLLSQSADSVTFQVMRLGTGIDTAFTYGAKTATLSGALANPANQPWGEYFAKFDFQTLLNTVLLGRIEVSRAIPRSEVPVLKNFADAAQRSTAISQLFELVRQQKAKIIFPEFEDLREVRDNVIVPYMKKITKNRTFVDIGDDNKNGLVDATADENTTETLVNGLEYYYRLLAYDEGDYRQLTPQKNSAGILDRNIIKTTPLAARAGNPVDITITSSTEDLLGGISNFQFIIKDQQRVQQLFGGHELEVEFQPDIFASGYLADAAGTATGIYQTNIILRDLTTGDSLVTYSTLYEPTQCGGTIIGSFSENAGVFVGCDSCDDKPIGLPTSTLTEFRSGTFTTDVFCNAPNRFAYNALGFSFNYTLGQQGGIYRPFSATITKGNATPGVAQASKLKAELTQAFNGEFVTFNEGAARYTVQFTPGDVETLRLKFGSPAQEKDFIVPFLNVKVVKDTKDTLPNEKIVGNTAEIGHTPLTVTTGRKFIDPRSIPVNSYNLAAYGWVDGDTENLIPARRKQSTQEGTQAIPVGTQGRYYLTGKSTDGANTVKFTHTFLGSGATFGMDFANKAGRQAAADLLFTAQPSQPTDDFESGDEVVFETFGGAIGLPKAGAKIRAKVSDVTALNDYTDDILSQVRVVPNPYYVQHDGQKSQYDAKIYFTKLPVECTISIYTINGDLIRTIEHNESNLPEETRTFSEGRDIWDLLSDNKQRVASQVLIAKIETPNGKSAIVKFSVVTGGFRTVPE
ncbi:MAG: hypothetical protein V4642_14305 [Bacteroidota bacterium]